MKFLLTRAKSFHLPGGRRGAAESIFTGAPGTIDAPEWIRETNTYRAGVADGSIRDFAPAGPTVLIPTKDQLLEMGYGPDVADEIITQQQELAGKFAAVSESKETKAEPASAVDPKTLGLSDGLPEPVDLPAPQFTKKGKTAK